METKTVQEYLINSLEKPVAIKGGGTLKDPIDGHEMTATEAIAAKIMQNALNGDLKAAQFVMQLEANERIKKKK